MKQAIGLRRAILTILMISGYTMFAAAQGLQSHKQETKSNLVLPGIQFTYTEHGDEAGMPVILINNSPETSSYKEMFSSIFPKALHVFELSQMVIGGELLPDNETASIFFTENIADFIKTRRLDAAVIMADAGSAYVAQQFASAYPEMTKALIIADPKSHKEAAELPAFMEEVSLLDMKSCD